MWISRKALAEEREKDRQLLTQIVREISETSRAQIRALEAQADAYRAHLAMFEVTEAPESRVVRDEDEWQMEMERVRVASVKLFGEGES